VEAILAGCNRYGIDNPCPIINKRMSLYGVPDDLVKEFKNLAKTYNEQCPGLNIDPDVLGPAELETGTRMEYTRQIQNTMDFKETTVESPLRKKAGIHNL